MISLGKNTMATEKAGFGIDLAIIKKSDNQISFIINFINESNKEIEFQFSENVDEAARLSLSVYLQGKLLEPAEYRQAIRGTSDIPLIYLGPGARHTFVMNGVLENSLLKFGRTSYIVKPGTYAIRFFYNGVESNEVEWIIA